MMLAPQAFVYISVGALVAAVVCAFYFLMGLFVAKDGLGPFGFLLWPTAGLMSIAFASQYLAIKGFNGEVGVNSVPPMK
ncbi:hypothetical protein [Rubrivivax gelatinosus]|uniref:hypothetical protein n=1 Tax=Rubrivivax gelatinosus TaxID=28068 RepID=UPI0005C247F7|nr:hypothetical protein [Rubrivivax gelatinosus]MBG6083100.1 hypothetical protein [Rubrivivax gelatinosus]